jgi:hypothetical protein
MKSSHNGTHATRARDGATSGIVLLGLPPIYNDKASEANTTEGHQAKEYESHVVLYVSLEKGLDERVLSGVSRLYCSGDFR